MLEQMDLELKILANEPISIGGIDIFPTKIKEIARFGYTRYNRALKILCVTQEEIKSLTGQVAAPFEFLLINSFYDESIKKLITDLLSLICKRKVMYSEEKIGFIVGKNSINRENFKEFVSAVSMINGIVKEEIDEHPSNEKARMILEKRRKLREKIIQNKKNSNLLQIPELVSVVAVSLNMSIRQVMEYNIYQLLDQFTRIIMKENYGININALIHGADKKDLDLVHWTHKDKGKID